MNPNPNIDIGAKILGLTPKLIRETIREFHWMDIR